MSDSHTDFNPHGVALGGLVAGATLAGAVVTGVRNMMHDNERKWDNWTRTQLVTALNLSEALRRKAHDELLEERALSAKLRVALSRITVRRARY